MYRSGSEREKRKMEVKGVKERIRGGTRGWKWEEEERRER